LDCGPRAEVLNALLICYHANERSTFIWQNSRDESVTADAAVEEASTKKVAPAAPYLQFQQQL